MFDSTEDAGFKEAKSNSDEDKIVEYLSKLAEIKDWLVTNPLGQDKALTFAEEGIDLAMLNFYHYLGLDIEDLNFKENKDNSDWI